MIKTYFEKANTFGIINEYIKERDNISDIITERNNKLSTLEKIKAFHIAKAIASAKEEAILKKVEYNENMVDFSEVEKVNSEIAQTKRYYNTLLYGCTDVNGNKTIGLYGMQEERISSLFKVGNGEKTADLSIDLYNAYLSTLYTDNKEIKDFSYITANGKQKDISFKYYRKGDINKIYKSFLIAIGFRGINCEGDLTSVINYLYTVVGAKVSKKGDCFIINIALKQFKELLVNAIIQYSINNKCYLYIKGEGLIH